MKPMNDCLTYSIDSSQNILLTSHMSCISSQKICHLMAIFSESRSQLDSWAKDNNNLMKAKQSLDDFINTFERDISELYKVWG
jgi:hypothetical protein